MKTLLCFAWVVVLSCVAAGAPCVPGNYQSFINLGANGCTFSTVEFTNFSMLPGQTVGTPIDASEVQVTPGGAALNPMLLFTLNRGAATGQVFELLLRFSASGPLYGASMGLTSPTVTGDGAVTGILDVCPNGSFAGGTPIGCPASPASLVVFAIDQSSLLSKSANIPDSNSFDVFADVTIDGGRNGSARLNSFSVAVTSIPEPSAGLLVALGLSAFGLSRARRTKPRLDHRPRSEV